MTICFPPIDSSNISPSVSASLRGTVADLTSQLSSSYDARASTARTSRKNQSAAVIDNSASATTASIDISTTNSSSSSSSACTSSCNGPSVRLYVGVDAEWKATMITNRGHPVLEPGAALLQVRYIKNCRLHS